MDILTLFTIIVSVVSIVLAIVAIVLSILFYRWSVESNRQIVAAAAKIDSNTERLQELFNKFYSDTFGIMKAAFNALQRKALNEENTDSASEKTEPSPTVTDEGARAPANSN